MDLPLQRSKVLPVDILQRDVIFASGGATAYKENVISDLKEWTAEGERCALITLVGVDGSAPRAEGAQMAVSERGRWSGYLSGGCLEQAIALEAIEAIRAQKARLLRYGKGSPYFDIRLPCGSGLDVFIQPVDAEFIGRLSALSTRRQPFQLNIDLSTGESALREYGSEAAVRSQRQGDAFLCAYTPSIHCLILGSSPIGAALAELSGCAGFDVEFYAPDTEILPPLPRTVRTHILASRPPLQTDPWTAAILTFHDHEQELPIFRELLGSDCFFITAIGSIKAHAARELALAKEGFSKTDIARIKSPAGLVPHLKTAPLVALSILAQIVAVARGSGIVS